MSTDVTYLLTKSALAHAHKYKISADGGQVGQCRGKRGRKEGAYREGKGKGGKGEKGKCKR